MTVRPEILLLIVACMAVTVIPRVLPMALINRVRLPAWLLAWLRYVPASVIGALFFRETFFSGGEWRAWSDPYFIAAWVALAAAFTTRSILWTIVIAFAAFAALRLLAG